MRYPKFSEFHEAKEKGLADGSEVFGKSIYPAGGATPPKVGAGFADEDGVVPNNVSKGAKGPNVGKGLGDEKGIITSKQWVPKVGPYPKVGVEGVTPPPVAGDGSYDGDLRTKPFHNDEDPLPYADEPDQTGVIVAGDEKPTNGLAFKATPGMEKDLSSTLSTPKFNVHDKPDVKHIGKITAEDFIKTTGKMSPSEFVNFYSENTEHEPLPTITDLNGDQFTPDPNQTIEYVAHLAAKNPRLMQRFVRETKRHKGGYDTLFNESKDHPDFVTSMIGAMGAPDGEGKKFCGRIGRGMNDTYMNELDKYVMEQRMNEEVQPKKDLSVEDGGPVGSGPENPSGMPTPKMKPPMPGGAFGGGGPAAPSQQPPGGAFGGGGPAGPNPPAPGGAFGGGGPMGGQTDGPDAGPPGMGGIGGGPPPQPPAPAFDGGGMKPPQPQPKLKGESAHGNMIEAMGGYPHMFTHMSDFCINGNCKKK